MLSLTIMLSGCPSDDNSANNIKVIEQLAGLGLEQNVHYEILSPGIDHPEGKVIVSEFFWYGCSHCYSAEPIVKDWKSSLPDDVEIVRVPVVWKPQMSLHAKVFYIGEQLLDTQQIKTLERQQLHESLFPVIMNLRSETNEDRQRTAIRDHFERFGISKALFDDLIESDTIKSKVSQAAEWQKFADIQGTPTFIIDGNYKIKNDEVEKPEDLITNGNQIIEAISTNK